MIKIISMLLLCLFCICACGATNQPVSMWEATPLGTDNTSATTNTADAGDYSTAGYPRKTGNPYVIRGVTYYPLQSVEEDYQETGIASWYGEDFHDKKTANGEIYDMNAFTAAHKTLPMPTFVRVENLDNGKETVVRVNDRGPFSKGRIIDLSYAAAKELDMIVAGTAKVRITVLSESADHIRTEGQDMDLNRGEFSLQIGAFASKSNADNLAAQFRTGAVSPVTRDGKTLYRVRIQGYATKAAADTALKSYERNYPGAFIVAE